MSSLQRFESNDGIELVINNQTGEAFATEAGYTRMSGIPKTTVASRVQKGVREGTVKTDEIHTAGGLQGVRLIPTKIVFKWLLKDNLPLAEAMGEVGATLFMHKLAGFEFTPTTQSKQEDSIDLLARILNGAGIDPKLTAGVQLNLAEKQGLLTRDAVAESHQILAASFESPLLYTPTRLGKELGVSARKINQLLLAAGFQVKNEGKKSKTEPAYIPTDKGREFSSNTLATGDRADSTTFQHLKWKQDIINVLKALVE